MECLQWGRHWEINRFISQHKEIFKKKHTKIYKYSHILTNHNKLINNKLQTKQMKIFAE